jgi:hypothetical protein
MRAMFHNVPDSDVSRCVSHRCFGAGCSGWPQHPTVADDMHISRRQLAKETRCHCELLVLAEAHPVVWPPRRTRAFTGGFEDGTAGSK